MRCSFNLNRVMQNIFVYAMIVICFADKAILYAADENKEIAFTVNAPKNLDTLYVCDSSLM